MPFDERIDARIDVAAVGDALQFIGHARQRRDHHQHAAIRILCPFSGQSPDRVPAVTTRHRGAAEFEHDPGGAGGVRIGHRGEWA
jgi:hypothetical protein